VSCTALFNKAEYISTVITNKETCPCGVVGGMFFWIPTDSEDNEELCGEKICLTALLDELRIPLESLRDIFNLKDGAVSLSVKDFHDLGVMWLSEENFQKLANVLGKIIKVFNKSNYPFKTTELSFTVEPSLGSVS